MKEVKCPSGAILKITPSPFKDAKALYQALLEEAKDLKITTDLELGQIVKDILCVGLSSKKIESTQTYTKRPVRENENVKAHVTEWENRCLKAEHDAGIYKRDYTSQCETTASVRQQWNISSSKVTELLERLENFARMLTAKDTELECLRAAIEG